MRRASAIRLALLACLWGASFLFIKVALRGLSPVQIVLGRLALGAAVLLIVVALRREPLPRSPIVWWHLAVAAVVANIVPYFLFGWGEQRTSSALAGVLNATTPLFTLVFALATRTEPRTTAVRLAGLLLGFVGALTVLAPWQVGSGQGSLSGQAACLLAAACYGVAYIYMRRFLTGRGFPPLALAASQLTAATVLLALVAPVLARQPITLTEDVLGSIIALGALGTGIAYLLNYRLIADEGATTASTVTYLLPIVAVVLGILILGEPLTWNVFVGTALILAGVALAEGRLGGRKTRGELRPTAEAPSPSAIPDRRQT
jgi:drug/metabolite transporter (DMT)-like permease